MTDANKRRILLLLAGAGLVGLSLFSANAYFGLAVSLLLAGMAFRDEKLGILYLLIVIPIRPLLTVHNAGYKYIGLLLIGLLVLRTLVQYRTDVKRLFRFHAFELAYFAFCLFGAAVAFTTGVSLGAIVMQLHAFLLFYLLFYVVSRMKVEEQDVRLFIGTTFFMSLVLALHGWVEKLSSRQWLLPEEWRMMELAETNRIRVYGLPGGPNELALYLVLAFFLSLYLLRNVKGRQAWFLYAGLTIIQTTFWLTYSRGALLTLMAFVPVYLLVYRKIPHWKQLFAITAAALLLFVSIGKTTQYLEARAADKSHTEPAEKETEEEEESTGVKRFTGALSQEEITMSQSDGRIYYFKKAFEVFQDRPVTGYGFGTYGSAATLSHSSPIYKQYGIQGNFYADNQYSEIMAETGIIGFVLILLFAGGMIWIAWRLRHGYMFSPLMVYLPIAAVVGGLVYSILENDIFTMYLFIIFGYAYRFLPKKP